MSTLVNVHKQIPSNRDCEHDHELTEMVMDSLLMKEFGQAMNLKMNEGRAKGKHGWFDDETITDFEIYRLLESAINRTDWPSVANYAAMLWGREKIREGSV